MYNYDSYFGTTEMWAASAEWIPMAQEGALGDNRCALQSQPTSAKTLVAIGLVASLISIGLGILAFGNMKVAHNVALLETLVPMQVVGWTNLK